MPKIQKNKIEQCTKIFVYRDLNAKKGGGILQPKELGSINRNAFFFLLSKLKIYFITVKPGQAFPSLTN